MFLTPEEFDRHLELLDNGVRSSGDTLMLSLTKGNKDAIRIMNDIKGREKLSKFRDVLREMKNIRLIGALIEMADANCNRNRTKLVSKIINHDKVLVDAVNETAFFSGISETALYDKPFCRNCCKPALLECPKCALEMRGPSSLFICSQECLDICWSVHSSDHAVPVDLRKKLFKKKVKHQMSSLSKLIAANYPLILFFVLVFPILVYCYTFWTRKYFGWGVAVIESKFGFG